MVPHQTLAGAGGTCTRRTRAFAAAIRVTLGRGHPTASRPMTDAGSLSITREAMVCAVSDQTVRRATGPCRLPGGSMCLRALLPRHLARMAVLADES